MKNLKILLILGILVGVVGCQKTPPTNSYKSSQSIQLNKCTDGDTAHFLVNGQDITIRFLAIDTPESVKPNTSVEPYAKEASEFTCHSLLTAKKIDLEYDVGNKTDKYGRGLAWVFVDGKLLQEELVLQGYAKIAYVYGNYKYLDRLYEAEAIVKEQQIGIWK